MAKEKNTEKTKQKPIGKLISMGYFVDSPPKMKPAFNFQICELKELTRGIPIGKNHAELFPSIYGQFCLYYDREKQQFLLYPPPYFNRIIQKTCFIEEINCPSCKSNDITLLVEKDQNNEYTYQCNNCKLVYYYLIKNQSVPIPAMFIPKQVKQFLNPLTGKIESRE